MKKNILCYFPCITDATSLYRGIGPLAALRKLDPNINIIKAPEVCTYAELLSADILFMQRPFTKNHLNIIKFAKAMNIPTWADYDDNLFCVPAENPAAETYHAKAIQEAMAEICATVDCISVTTESLKKELSPLNKNIWVVPNAHNDYLFNKFPKCEEQNAIILWRGSKTHAADLNLAAEACISLANAHKNWTWQFLGERPWFANYMPQNQVLTTKALDPIAYFDFLSVLKPAVVIVPLQNNRFNHAKSNIAWLEAAYAGAPALVPEFPQWQNPGATNYIDSADFEVQLSNLLRLDDTTRLKKARDSWDYVLGNYLLSDINKLRLEMIQHLTGESFEKKE